MRRKFTHQRFGSIQLTPYWSLELSTTRFFSSLKEEIERKKLLVEYPQRNQHLILYILSVFKTASYIYLSLKLKPIN